MPRLFSREVVETLNDLGGAYGNFAVAMFVQLAVLLALLAVLDFLWLKRTRATVRYAVWSLILVKLMLPVGLQGPLSFTGLLNLIPRGATEILATSVSRAQLDISNFEAGVSPLPGTELKAAESPPVHPGKHYLQVEPFWLEAENAKQGSKIIEVKAGEILEGIELYAAPHEREVPPETAALPFTARVLDSQGKPVANIPVGLGVLGGAQNVRSDDQGRAPLQTDFMSRMRQSTSLVYAVDSVENRAGIAVLNLQDHVSADPKNAPVIDIPFKAAAPVRVVVDATQFNRLGKNPLAIQLSVAKVSMPLHRQMLPEPSAAVLILPPGDYQITASEPYLVEQTTVHLNSTSHTFQGSSSPKICSYNSTSRIGSPSCGQPF